MNRKKILFLLPSLVGGGAERTLVNLLDKLDYTEYDITLLLILRHGTYLDQIPTEVRIIDLFTNKNFTRVLYYLQKKLDFDAFLKYQIKSKIKDSYDVGICFLDGNFTDILLMIPNVKKRYSWVHSSYKSNHSFYKFYKNINYRNKLIKERYNRLDGIYFVSFDAMKEFKELFGGFDKMEVIYNIIDAESIFLKSKEVTDMNLSNKFNFLSIGSLLPVKGYNLLIDAIKQLKEKREDFHLTILGEGPLEKKLKEQVLNLRVQNHVSFFGFHSNPYKFLKNCDVFVMSSVSEALPTVLCEAMILGKPVIVTNCSGCRELVDQGEFGMMAEMNKISLVEKMNEMLDNDELRLHFQRKSKERSDIFNDQKILDKYYQIFNS